MNNEYLKALSAMTDAETDVSVLRSFVHSLIGMVDNLVEGGVITIRPEFGDAVPVVLDEVDVASHDEWNTAYEALQVKVDAACLAAGHEKVNVLYSAYSTDARGVPEDNLNEMVVRGAYQIVSDGNLYFGNGEHYKSNNVDDPTWLDIAVAANESIPVTGDYHHTFLESVSIDTEAQTITMSFGS